MKRFIFLSFYVPCTFYLRFWFVTYMTVTATFQFTFAEVPVCWSNIIVTSKSSQPLCREKSFTCHNAIYQTKFDSLNVMRKTQYLRWQWSWWHKGVVLKKVWKRTWKTSSFQQHFKLIFESVFNDVGLFTFIALQTKTLKKCGIVFPPHDTPGMTVVREAAALAVVLVAVVLGGSCPRWQLSWVAIIRMAVVLGGNCPR